MTFYHPPPPPSPYPCYPHYIQCTGQRESPSSSHGGQQVDRSWGPAVVISHHVIILDCVRWDWLAVLAGHMADIYMYGPRYVCGRWSSHTPPCKLPHNFLAQFCIAPQQTIVSNYWNWLVYVYIYVSGWDAHFVTHSKESDREFVSRGLWRLHLYMLCVILEICPLSSGVFNASRLMNSRPGALLFTSTVWHLILIYIYLYLMDLSRFLQNILQVGCSLWHLPPTQPLSYTCTCTVYRLLSTIQYAVFGLELWQSKVKYTTYKAQCGYGISCGWWYMVVYRPGRQ